jgi:hypothetical protein
VNENSLKITVPKEVVTQLVDEVNGGISSGRQEDNVEGSNQSCA